MALFLLMAAMFLTWHHGSGQITNDADVFDITSLHINADIWHRLATTHVTSMLRYTGTTQRETVFYLNLPDGAMVNHVSVTVNGQAMIASVVEKMDSKRNSGKSVPNPIPRDFYQLYIATKLPAGAAIMLNVTYVEVLQRRFGTYEYKTFLSPGRVLNSLEINIKVEESGKITKFKVPHIQRTDDTLSGGRSPEVSVSATEPHMMTVQYSPDIEQQQNFSDAGVYGVFRINYVINHSNRAGEIQAAKGHFVQYLSVDKGDPLPKNILFVLDTSGSMAGPRLQMMKDAMHKILGMLRPRDRFNIMAYNRRVKRWKHSKLVPATPGNIESAGNFVENLTASFSTNINKALQAGLRFFLPKGRRALSGVRLMYFLTDGKATEGITKPDTILQRVARRGARFSLQALGFGPTVDFEFLQKLARQHDGRAFRVQERSDSGAQMENIYKLISTPLLSKIDIGYRGDPIVLSSLTSDMPISTYFRGSEVIVAGKLSDARAYRVWSCVRATSRKGVVKTCQEIPESFDHVDKQNLLTVKHVETMWAYLRLRHLLSKLMTVKHKAIGAAMKREIGLISKKYNFLTPLTSMKVKRRSLIKKIGIWNGVYVMSKDGGQVGHRSPWFRGHLPLHVDHPRWEKYTIPTRPARSTFAPPTTPLAIDQGIVTTEAPPVDENIPVLAVRVRNGQDVCFRWPRAALYNWYKALQDRTLQVRMRIRTSPEGQAFMTQIDINSAGRIRVYVSQYAMRINSTVVRWGQSVSLPGIRTTEDMVLLMPFDGVAMEIHRVPTSGPQGPILILYLKETTSLSGKQSGILAPANDWYLSDKTLYTSSTTGFPGYGPRSIANGRITCVTPYDDLFKVLGSQAYGFQIL